MINLKSIFNKYIASEDGATAVEFSLVVLPFMLLSLGIMEAGRIAWTVNSVRYSIEETNRYASINSGLDAQAIEQYARGKLTGMMISSDALQILSTVSTANGIDFIEVEGSYEVSTSLTGFIPGDFGKFNFTTTARKPVIN